MMTINEIAAAFGMTIGQFAESIGYTRQALYLGSKHSTPRREAAICVLRELSDAMLLADEEKAKRRYEARENAIKEFEKMPENGGDSECNPTG